MSCSICSYTANAALVKGPAACVSRSESFCFCLCQNIDQDLEVKQNVSLSRVRPTRPQVYYIFRVLCIGKSVAVSRRYDFRMLRPDMVDQVRWFTGCCSPFCKEVTSSLHLKSPGLAAKSSSGVIRRNAAGKLGRVVSVSGSMTCFDKYRISRSRLEWKCVRWCRSSRSCVGHKYSLLASLTVSNERRNDFS